LKNGTLQAYSQSTCSTPARFYRFAEKNILKRYKELSKDPLNEGLSLIAYGDKEYNTEWTKLMTDAADYVKANTGVADYSYGWCGHIAHYSPDSTTIAINQVLQKKKTAVVIPVLVAFDEMFQVQIIGDGIKKYLMQKKEYATSPMLFCLIKAWKNG
jgi:hypothetical protein